MTAAYNLTQINASGGVLTFTQGVNEVLLGGMLGAMILIGIAVIIYTSVIFTTNDPKKALVMTTFSTFILSFPLVGLNLLHPFGLYASLVLLGLAMAFSRNKD